MQSQGHPIWAKQLQRIPWHCILSWNCKHRGHHNQTQLHKYYSLMVQPVQSKRHCMEALQSQGHPSGTSIIACHCNPRDTTFRHSNHRGILFWYCNDTGIITCHCNPRGPLSRHCNHRGFTSRHCNHIYIIARHFNFGDISGIAAMGVHLEHSLAMQSLGYNTLALLAQGYFVNLTMYLKGTTRSYLTNTNTRSACGVTTIIELYPIPDAAVTGALQTQEYPC